MKSWRGAIANALAEPSDPKVVAAIKEAEWHRELSLSIAGRCLHYYKKGEIRGIGKLIRELEKHTDALSPRERDEVIGRVVREAYRIEQPPKPKGPKWDDWVTYRTVEAAAGEPFNHPKNPRAKSPGAGDKMSAFEVAAEMLNKSEGMVRKAYYAVEKSLPTKQKKREA